MIISPNKNTMMVKLHAELDRKRHDPIIPGLVYKGWSPDLISVTRAGLVNEYRLIASRSDFLAMVASPTRQTSANYIWLVCPETMIAKVEVPMQLGLIWVTREGRTGQGLVKRELPTLKTIVRPARLHKRKVDAAVLAEVERVFKREFWCAFSKLISMDHQRQIWKTREAVK